MFLSKILCQSSSAWWHWCPACNQPHPVPTNRGWEFNQDFEKPTFSPSVRQCLSPDCHYYIRDGKIQYCNDSRAMAGQTVPLPEFPEETYT